VAARIQQGGYAEREVDQSTHGKLCSLLRELFDTANRVPVHQGWTSTSDPLSNVSMSFKTAEQAMAFCNRNSLAYEVTRPKQMRKQKKNYGDNFRYWGRVVDHKFKADPTQIFG
jgi:leucyl-tRNA synthetase